MVELKFLKLEIQAVASNVEFFPRGTRVLETCVPPFFFSNQLFVFACFFFFLSSFPLPSSLSLPFKAKSSSSYPIWSSIFLPLFFFFFFFILDLFLCSLFLCSCPIWFVLIRFTIEIESWGLGFTFYKLESLRLEIYVAKNNQINKSNLSIWDSISRLKLSLWNSRC